MFAVLLLTLAASPELTFDQGTTRVVAAGQTYDVTSAVSSTTLTSLVVWVAQGRMGIERPSIYAARVQPNGNVNDPEGLLVSEPFGRDPAVAWVPTMDAWVVAWEWNGQVLLRVVRPDGSVHPATVTPVNLGQGRAPGIAPHGAGYFVTFEATRPTAQLMTPPATPSLVGSLGQTALPYARPVRAADITGSSSLMTQTSWVEGTSLVSAKVTAMGSVSVTPGTHLTSSVRLDLDALANRNDVAFAAYRISDGGSSSLEVMRLDLSNRVAIDAGTDVTFANLTTLANGAFALTSTHADGRGRAWHVFTDGGFTGLGTVVNGASRVSASAFADVNFPTLLLWTTFNDGVFAQPSTLSLAPTQTPVQLSYSRSSDRSAQVASWSGGALAVWQRLTTLEAQTVAWRVFPDGGHAMTADVIDSASRFDVPAVTSLSGGVAMLTNDRLRVMNAAGTWAPALTLPRALRSASLTPDRSGRLVVIGEQPAGADEEAWALRYEPDGSVTERLVFPQVSPKPERPRLAIARDGGAALAVINPGPEVWATRLTSDLVARDDGGFRVSGPPAVNPFVVSDEQGGFLVVYTDTNDVFARRVVDTSVGAPIALLNGEWDVGSVIEVPGGAAVVATSRETAALVTVSLTVDTAGVLTSSAQTVVSGGSYTNGPGLAVGESLTWVFGRYDPDAGVATTRSVVASRAVGATCQLGWQCLSGRCVGGICRAEPVSPDGGAPVDAGTPDAGGVLDGGVPDAGATLDAGSASDAGLMDAGVMDAGVDAGAEDAGVMDAGVDAGPEDAGVLDAGALDAGGADGGASVGADAGVEADGGARGASSYRAGCDCQAGSGPWLISAALVLLSARRRRRL